MMQSNEKHVLPHLSQINIFRLISAKKNWKRYQKPEGARVKQSLNMIRSPEIRGPDRI